MKRYTIRQTLLAPALLLAAALGAAGCSQSNDDSALPTAGETLNIRIAPKPGFASSSTDTRATTDDATGAFGWQTDDRIYARLEFDDASTTLYRHTWIRTADAAPHGYMTGWKVMNMWALDISEEITGDIAWPLGATKVTVWTAYTDCEYREYDGSAIIFSYDSGATADFMTFQGEFARGEAITVNLEHIHTRLVFTGLTPSTEYTLKAGASAVLFPRDINGFGYLDRLATSSFTSDADGKLVICAPLNEKIDAASGKVTLELLTGGATGTVTNTVELTARGSAGSWEMDGRMYTVNFPTAGTVDPGSRPDLLTPDPIVPGNAVWEVNGYYVTAPEADPAKTYTWDAANNAATGPCVGHGNWRMPAMKDFEKMLDWSGIHSWADIDSEAMKEIITVNSSTEYDKWDIAFHYYDSNELDFHYWSSDSHQAGSDAWSLFRDAPSGFIKYSIDAKTSTYYARCVQKQ